MSAHDLGSTRRRSFLSRFAVGFAAAFSAGGAAPRAQARSSGPWQSARHNQDDWLDEIAGRHRFVFDTTSPGGLGSVLLYANNFFLASKNGYGLENADAAVVIVVRHHSTPFAYNDAMWAKYGSTIGQAT